MEKDSRVIEDYHYANEVELEKLKINYAKLQAKLKRNNLEKNILSRKARCFNALRKICQNISYSDTMGTEIDLIKSLIDDTVIDTLSIKVSACRKGLNTHKCENCVVRNRSSKMKFCSDVCAIKRFTPGTAWHTYLSDKIKKYCLAEHTNYIKIKEKK